MVRFFARHHERYGSPRLHRALIADFWTVSHRRDARLMAAAGLRAKALRGHRAKAAVHQRYTQYMGTAFCHAIVNHGMRQSASVRGPGDSAHAESFWHSLKAALTRGVVVLRDHALRTALRGYIRYYNRTRLHSTLNYTSPIAFERCAA